METLVIALPPAAAASLRASAPRTPLEHAARAAASTPSDDAAPAVWRGGREIFLPAVEDAVTRGVLRDAWRQRAVYRTGRLALVLRAIEAEVRDASGEGDLTAVAVREGPRWRFNRAVLERAVSAQPLGAEGARDLGGLPLSLDSLEAADPALTFDRVARRVTRARLLRVLVALRGFVHERGLDLRFARRGEVESWLVAMLDEGLVQEADLRDGWGHALALRASASPRFRLFTPVAGYELVAPGPDGRAGTADDVWDPIARVLPSGGLYASAVDEDGLLVRLQGVALARATVAELSTIFDEDARGGVEVAPPPTWDDVPSALRFAILDTRDAALLDDPLDPRPAGRATDAFVGALDEWRLPDAPGRYVVLTFERATFERAGGGPGGGSEGRSLAEDQLVTRAALARGGDVRFVSELPSRWPSAPLRQRLDFVALRDLTGLRLEIEAEGAEVEATGGARDAAAGTRVTWPTRLRATQPAGRVVLRAVDAGGRVHATVEHTFRRDEPNRATRDRRGGALLREGAPWSLDVPTPEGATNARARLVVTAPGRLHRDPLVRAWAPRAPALVAWAAVLSGDTPSREVRDALAHDPRDALARACASVARLGLSDRGVAARALAIEPETQPKRAAALLVALAPTAPPPWEERDTTVERLREVLRDTTRTHADEPLVLARAAAALLSADPRDESGRLLLARAARRFDDRGFTEDASAAATDPRDALTATVALAIAAHHAGDAALRDRALAIAAPRAWLGLREPGELAFWWLAASASGALGAAEDVELLVDGAPVALTGGLAQVPLEGRWRAEVAVRGARALARFEARYDDAIPDADAPFALTVEGHPGRADRPAALELVVEAKTASEEPRLLVRLPAASTLDPGARAALTRTAGVREVSEGPDGALVIALHPLASGEVRRLPLRLRWLGAGERVGPALAAWDAARPWASASRPGTTLTIAPRRTSR
ncbi:MAG: hypothetical protein KF901_31350 [Myxococcales bacterium]|nr:hypothetical protein [Myxococcales bacterium]